MAVTGAHVILYTSQAEALRETFHDVFGWSHVDAGDGWLIFALPPAEVAVHPADAPSHELALVCDDLAATVAALEAKGITFDGEPVTAGWGTASTMVLPGGVRVMLYQPRHQTAF